MEIFFSQFLVVVLSAGKTSFISSDASYVRGYEDGTTLRSLYGIYKHNKVLLIWDAH